MDVDVTTCSKRFLKGVKWLENSLKFDEIRLKNELEETRKKLEEIKRIKENESNKWSIINLAAQETTLEFKIQYL